MDAILFSQKARRADGKPTVPIPTKWDLLLAKVQSYVTPFFELLSSFAFLASFLFLDVDGGVVRHVEIIKAEPPRIIKTETPRESIPADITASDKKRLRQIFREADTAFCKLAKDTVEYRLDLESTSEREAEIKKTMIEAKEEMEKIAANTGKSFEYIAARVVPETRRSINYEWCLLSVLNRTNSITYY